jgi:hypothetical protein
MSPHVVFIACTSVQKCADNNRRRDRCAAMCGFEQPRAGTLNINIDIFSRTARLKSLDAIRELSQTFGACEMSIHEIARAENPHAHQRRH